MSPTDQFQRRLKVGRELLAHRITIDQAKAQLRGSLGLGADDVALMTVMAVEADLLAAELPLDLGQRFSEFAQEIEDPISTLARALEAESAHAADLQAA